MSDREPDGADEQPEPQEVELPTAELNLEGVAPTLSVGPTPATVSTPIQVPGAGVSVAANAGVAEVNVVALDATAEATSGVSGTLDVTEAPDVLNAQGTVGPNDHVTTGLLSGGAILAVDNALHATHSQTPSLDVEVLRAAPTLDDATEAELTAVVPHDVMADLEAVIVRLDRQLEERRDFDEHVQEMQAELLTLRAQLTSSKPKRVTVSSALWSVTCWATGFGNNVLANAAYDVLKRVLGH
jgi:hypothetical protein